MISSVLTAGIQLYQFVMPDEDALSGKISQFTGKGRQFSPLEGTIAMCKVTAHGTLKKEIRPTALTQRFRVAASLCSVIPGQSRDVFMGLGKCAEYETNASHEYSMLEKFYVAWRDHPRVFTPCPIGLYGNTVEMQYVPWTRLHDLKQISFSTLTLVKKFFLDSIHTHRLLHGDMSAFNVLVDTANDFRDGKAICVVDMGLSLHLSDEEYQALCIMKREEHLTITQVINQAWDGHVPFTQSWFDKLKESLTLSALTTNFQIVPGSEKILAVFVRSLLLISQMFVSHGNNK